MIIKVEEDVLASICDEFLTDLIQDERKYNPTIKENFIVSDYFKNVIKNRKEDFLYIYKEENEYIGYIYLKKQEDGYLIDGLFVMGEYRNKGIATKLVNHAITKVKETGYKNIYINVMLKNEGALNLYRKLGFSDLSICLMKNI